VFPEVLAKQLRLDAACVPGAQCGGQVRDEHANPVLANGNVEACGPFAANWFFNKKDAVHSSTARQKMLRPLKDEIPSQVRQADDVE
jgi:hypothetical protein